MKKKLLIIPLLGLFILFQCGGSDLEEGNTQYAAGKYTQAVNKYLAFKKANPNNKEIDSKLTLAYFSKGKQLFDKTRNLEAFAGNYNNAMKYMPEKFATVEQSKEYSNLLFEFAKAYKKTKPDNEIQEEEYFSNTLDYLGQAINYDPDNTAADELLNQIYNENFQKMYDAGVKNYTNAKKLKEPDLYLRAERYLKRAVEFSNGDEEAQKLLNSTRKQTISILEADYPLSFCIPVYKIQKNSCFIGIAMQNFSDAAIPLDLEQLNITTTDGQVIKPDRAKTAELEKALADKAVIKTNALLEGQLVFQLPGNTVPEQISYTYNNEKTVRKYFPL